MVKSSKSFDTGLRVLEILKILQKGDFTKVELIEELKKNSKIGKVYTLEAFIKYFNTLELLGFKLKKNKTKYGLANALFEITLTPEEKELLCAFISEYKKIHSDKDKENFKNIILKLNKFLNPPFENDVLKTFFEEEQQVCTDNIRNNLIITLENYLKDGQLVQIKYQRTKNIVEELVVEIKEITERKNNIFVNCYCSTSGRFKNICIDSILSLTQLPKKNTGASTNNSVVFKLYGRLASSYKLKPNEKVIDFDNYHLTVSNSSTDKEALLRRLLKYGSNCRIEKPQSIVDEFLAMTNEILKNLQEDE